MVEQFQNLLAIFWGVLKLMFGIVRTMSRWR